MAEDPDTPPLTAGELGRRLEERGLAWSVDPRLGDDDPLPEYPRGGLLPDDETAAAQAFEGDLESALADDPPTNPFLRARWSELGLLPPER